MTKGKNRAKLDFIPAPGIIIVDPITKTQKSENFAVNDTVDDPHRGYVIAVGEAKPSEQNPDKVLKTNVLVGDLVLYSIVGCERTRLEYDKDLRHEFVVVPFNRILGVIGK